MQIVDGINHPEGDGDDLLVVVILDSKLRKGRIEFRKQMSKQEMDFCLLSTFAEICDLRANGGVTEGEPVLGGGGSGGGARSAHQGGGVFEGCECGG
jgi:hypothetical protein